MNLSFELIRTRERLLTMAEEWRALWTRSHGDYFLSFESVLLSWDKVHARQGRRMSCALVRDGAALIAVMPMVAYRRGLWRVASPIGPDAAEGADILQADGTSPGIADALFRFFVAEVRPDVVAFAFVRAGNALDLTVRRSDFTPIITNSCVMPYAVLSSERSWADYERSLSRSTQQQIGRKQRRMQEAGALDFEIIEGAADESIDWLLTEKAKWGRKVGKQGPWLFSAQYRAYLKAYAEQGEQVLTFVLRFKGVPAAVKVVVVGPTLCSLIIAAYDETLNRSSPGNILDQFWIRHVFETFSQPDGRRLNINFGSGAERYKMHWGRGISHVSTTYKLPVTRWGRLPYRAKSVARMLRRLAGASNLRRPSALRTTSDNGHSNDRPLVGGYAGE